MASSRPNCGRGRGVIVAVIAVIINVVLIIIMGDHLGWWISSTNPIVIHNYSSTRLPGRCLEDGLLVGVAGEEAVDGHVPLLADAVAAGHCLQVVLRNREGKRRYEYNYVVKIYLM